MAGSVNKVILIGNVGKDPEIRSFNTGGKVANFSLATSESWKDKTTGEKKEKTDWHNIAVFNEGLVGIIERYVHKGSKIYIEGQLKTRKWQDRDGNDKYTTEVVLSGFNGSLTLLNSKGDSNRPPAAESEHEYGRESKAKSEDPDPAQKFDLDDEIPF